VLAVAELDAPHDVRPPVQLDDVADAWQLVKGQPSRRDEVSVLVRAIDAGDRCHRSCGLIVRRRRMPRPDSSRTACRDALRFLVFFRSIPGNIGTPLLAVYFIDSTAFAIAWKLSLLLVAVFWLGLACWVFRDARRRIADWPLVGTAALLGIVPLVGPLVYLLFRPPETLADVRLRDAEVRVLEQRLGMQAPSCPVCRTSVEPDFLVCPVCTTRLRLPCPSCKAALEPLWQVCPYCATPSGAVVVTVDLDAALTAEVRAAARAGGTQTPAA
jgi:RNA polymerase subunit RPABC4/transcription elongation factor Spt4